jgi:putative endopeptidase
VRKYLLTVGLMALSVPMLSAPALAAEGKAAIGSFGVDLAGMDRSVKPGDDFHKFVNGGWISRTEFPADKPYIGVAVDVDEKARAQVRAIIEAAAADTSAAPGSVTRKVGDFYAAFMDEAGIEAKGLAPVQPLLAEIAAVNSQADLLAAIGKANRRGVNQPFGGYIASDDKNPEQIIVRLAQGGLRLPDRDYYLVNDNPDFAKAREAFLEHAQTMFTIAGLPDAKARAAAVLALETDLARVHWTSVESRDSDKTYNKIATADLATRFPGADWSQFLAASGIAGEKLIIVSQPSALAGTARLLGSAPLSVWKDYLTLNTLEWASSVLPARVVDAQFAFNRALTGQQAKRPRWQRAGAATTAALGDAVGQIYVEKHFPPDAKTRIDALVKNVIAAMNARLGALDWMTPETRVLAQAKLASFTAKIGYPDRWKDYGPLVVDKSDALGNRLRSAELGHQRELAKLSKPADRSEWFMSPMDVNAYAYPPWNEVAFTAAFLQPPFFDANGDDAVNYGAVAATIGHEIVHHFDDQGRKYDKTGRLTDWWTAEDVKRFEARAAVVTKQYGAYEVAPGKPVNGELTLGENIADLAGLLVAWDAFQMARKSGTIPDRVIDGFTPEQRFFLGYAQSHRSKMRPELLQLVISSDPHAPDEFRSQTVRNVDAWYQAFGVKPGDKLYLPPEQRARPW